MYDHYAELRNTMYKLVKQNRNSLIREIPCSGNTMLKNDSLNFCDLFFKNQS